MKKSIFQWSLLFLVAIALQTPIFADRVGEVTYLKGQADVTRSKQPLKKLNKSDAIFEKDVIRTKSDSLLVVTMKDKGRLTLAENSRIEVAKYVIGHKPEGLVEMSRGRLRAYVTDEFSKRSESFKVRTPTAVAGVQGTDFGVTVRARFTQIFVYSGTVVVYNVNPKVKGRQIVYAGQQTIVMEGEPPTVPASFEIIPPGAPGEPDSKRRRQSTPGDEPDSGELIMPPPPPFTEPSPSDQPPAGTSPAEPIPTEPPSTEPPPSDPPPSGDPPHGHGPPPHSNKPDEPPGQARPVEEHPSKQIPPGLSKPGK